MSENHENFGLSILVSNKYGILTRVSGIFSKRGYNIESLYATPLEGTPYSNIRLSSSGDEAIKEQIIKQLEKLHDIQKVELIPLSEIIPTKNIKEC